MNTQLTTFLRVVEKETGVEFFYVGGTVRDHFLCKESEDVDLVARNFGWEDLSEALAKFGKVEATGDFFKVLRWFPSDRSLPIMEVAIPRTEVSTGPGVNDWEVDFDPDLPIEEDLRRRDFTINAGAIQVSSGRLIAVDNFLEDLSNGPTLRFLHDRSCEEDSIRMLRAIKFLARFPNARLLPEAEEQITNNAHRLKERAAEAVRKEILGIVVGPNSDAAVHMAVRLGVFDDWLPELVACAGVTQNKYHSYDVLTHCARVMQETPTEDPIVKLAALLHDIGKEPTRWVGDDGEAHFYEPEPGQVFLEEPRIAGHHEVVGADMVWHIMTRLRFSVSNVHRAAGLVREHMFIQGNNLRKKSARKLLKRLHHIPGGIEANVNAIFDIREGDCRGKVVTPEMKANIESNRAFQKIVLEELAKDCALTTHDLVISGNDLIDMGLEPGPVFKQILESLLELVVDEPDLNTREFLLSRAQELATQS